MNLQARVDRTVHGHGTLTFVQRYAVKQDLHVLHAVDGDARLADVARHARVVAVIAAVGREIEGHAEAHSGLQLSWLR